MNDEELKVLAEKVKNGTATTEERTTLIKEITKDLSEINKVIKQVDNEDKIEKLKQELEA